jgi:hypothetical protein
MITRIKCYPIIDSHFDEFFLKPEEIISKEVLMLRDEISQLKAIIKKKDNHIKELIEPIPSPAITNHVRKANLRNFAYKCGRG